MFFTIMSWQPVWNDRQFALFELSSVIPGDGAELPSMVRFATGNSFELSHWKWLIVPATSNTMMRSLPIALYNDPGPAESRLVTWITCFPAPPWVIEPNPWNGFG